MLLANLTRLDQLNTNHGLIGGFESMKMPNTIYCFSASLDQDCLPSGHIVVGLFDYSEKGEIDQDLINLSKKLINLKAGQVIIFEPSSATQSIGVFFIDMKNKEPVSCEHDWIDDDDLLKELNIVTCVGYLPITVKIGDNQDVFKKNITLTFQTFKSKLVNLHFNLKHSDFKLVSNVAKDLTFNHLYSLIKDEEIISIDEINAPQDMKIKMKEKVWKKKIANKLRLDFDFNHLKDESFQNVEETNITFGLSNLKLNLNFEIVLMIESDTQLCKLYQTLITCVQRQGLEYRKCFLTFWDPNDSKLYIPKSYNFWPKLITSYYLSVAYPASLKDDQLKEYRRQIHLRLLLPMDRPLIRKANRFRFEANKSKRYLINPHVDLKRLPLKGASVSLIKGDYTYYHYNQDGVDDNGWGCAYRSLQTLISWFNHQGYIEIEEIPSHRKIQQTLVEVGDKEPKFVGSSLWIGSQEVSYVLNQLYGIVSKIIFVSNGSELSTKGRELRHHFETQGTPVMIGGGVLAHTILGVDYNDKTGDIAYLVLDPHYTGLDDVNLVQKKGWCGWKKNNFWDAKSFYNLCLPQRPNEF